MGGILRCAWRWRRRSCCRFDRRRPCGRSCGSLGRLVQGGGLRRRSWWWWRHRCGILEWLLQGRCALLCRLWVLGRLVLFARLVRCCCRFGWIEEVAALAVAQQIRGFAVVEAVVVQLQSGGHAGSRCCPSFKLVVGCISLGLLHWRRRRPNCHDCRSLGWSFWCRCLCCCRSGCRRPGLCRSIRRLGESRLPHDGGMLFSFCRILGPLLRRLCRNLGWLG